MKIQIALIACRGLVASILLLGFMDGHVQAQGQQLKTYSSEQLKLLFSGSKIRAVGDCYLNDPGVLDMDFDFNKDGTFLLDFQCMPTTQGPYVSQLSGSWSVSSNEVCLDFVNPTQFIPTYDCYRLANAKTGFDLYFRDQATPAWRLDVAHPDYPTSENLLAALDRVAAEPRKVSSSVPEHDDTYTNEQLKLLFSGSNVRATGECYLSYVGDLVLDFSFDESGSFSLDFECTPGAMNTLAGDTTGTWYVQNRELCLEFGSPTQFVPDRDCYKVTHGGSSFDLYFLGQDHPTWELTFSHTKYANDDELLAALEEVGRRFAAVDSNSAQGSPTSSPSLSPDIIVWQNIQSSGQIDIFHRFLKEYPDSQFAVLAQIKIEQLSARSDAPENRPLIEAKLPDQGSALVETESQQWLRVKASRDFSVVQTYLSTYPNSQFAAEAEAFLTVLTKLNAVSDVEFGAYHALIIGIDDYQHLRKLNTALNDARAIANVLEHDYGFKITMLENPTRGEIIDTFDELRETLGRDDNLLIYYAGHGWLDKEADRGYWLPVDAKPGRRSQWVSNATLSDTLRSLQSRHVMILADSCFSGTLTRNDSSVRSKSGDYWRRMAEKQARVVITSGGLEPVADADVGGQHSPFARALMNALAKNEAIIDGTTLFNTIRRPVMVAAEQTPEYSDVQNSGHDGGDFLLIKKH